MYDISPELPAYVIDYLSYRYFTLFIFRQVKAGGQEGFSTEIKGKKDVKYETGSHWQS